MTVTFTYLDSIDPTISFEPIMYRNRFERDGMSYSLFSDDENNKFNIPGYKSFKCVIDKQIAIALSKIQKILLSQYLSLKIYDAYRPVKAVNYFTHWSKQQDNLLQKQYHYPNVNKKDLHLLSYLSQTSSHSLGTAVDLTIINKNNTNIICPQDFLGYWDRLSIDMGVGYLCFDEKSSINYKNLTQEQLGNRQLLSNLMISHGFEPLESEFWHYYYKKNRNLNLYYDFDITDNLF